MAQTVPTTVLVDARNVLRSEWPNIPEDELVEAIGAWARESGVRALAVFDGMAPQREPDAHLTVLGTGPESADDWLAREAAGHAPYWLVTSDRELRQRAGGGAERILGGGSFARTLRPYRRG